MSFSIHTPLIESLPLSNICGTRVFAKMDALQPSGSFKMRGIGYAAQHYAAQGAKRFISSSGGNAGLAVAYAGRAIGLPVLVVVPETTPQRAIDLLEQEKADVIVHGTSWIEANALAQSKRTETDAFFHPFDDPLLWAGHASMIDEVVADGLRPDAVILSVGGGWIVGGRSSWFDPQWLDHDTYLCTGNPWHGLLPRRTECEGASDPRCRQRRGHILGRETSVSAGL